MMTSDFDAMEYLRQTRRHHKWLFKIRPNALASPLYKLLTPYERRVVIPVGDIRFLCDPMSYTAGEILEHGTYEKQTVALLNRYLKPGDVFLDIGANEGFIASVAARIVGGTGTVIAVEPQSEVFRVLHTNLSLNAAGRVFAFRKALADTDGQTITIHLAPHVNSGTSSLVSRTRLSRTEPVDTLSFGRLLELTGVGRFDLVKIDVEGYEKEIVDSMLHSGRIDLIRALAVDYHASILAARGIDPNVIETPILSAGFTRAEAEGEFTGYTVYTR